MVIRRDSEVSGIDQLRSQIREIDEGYRSHVQPVQVAVRQDGNSYRYPGDVITVYIGTRIVYCGDCVNAAVESVCEPGGIDYEVWTI